MNSDWKWRSERGFPEFRSPGTVAVLAAATVVCLLLLLPQVFVYGAPAPAAAATVMGDALVQRDSLPAAVGSIWRFVGPTNWHIGAHYYGLAPYSGRVNGIAVHPTNPAVIFVTGPTGGAWKTTDRGLTWASRSQNWPIQSATAVEIDPNNGDTVFVGTGDYKRLDHIEPFSVGIMRSLDGGLSWSNVGSNEMREFTVSRIVVDRANSQIVVATTGRGSRLPGGQIFRSTDGGEHWASVTNVSQNLLPQANWDDLELCDGHVFWASATRRNNLDVLPDNRGSNGLLYASYDSGTTWTNVNIVTTNFNLNNPASRPDTIQIACRTGSSNVFVAVYESNLARIFFTGNKGTNWSEIPTAGNFYPIDAGQGTWAHNAFCVTSNLLYIGGDIIFRGQLASGKWVFTNYFGPVHPHDDNQCAVPDPMERDAIFLATDGGLYRYSAQSNASFSLNQNLGSLAQIYRMDVHDRHGGLMAFAAQDLGTSVSFYEQGQSIATITNPPSWAVMEGGDAGGASFKNDSSSEVYLADSYANLARYDGSTNNPVALLAGPEYEQGQPLIYNNNRLYHADSEFWCLDSPDSKDTNTANWVINQFTPRPQRNIQAMDFCAANSQVICAASKLGELFYSTNSGSNWSSLDRTGLPTSSLPIWAISVSPTDCRDVLVAFGYEDTIYSPIATSIRRGSNFFYPDERLFRNTNVVDPSGWVAVHGTTQSLPRAPLFAIQRLPSAVNSNWFVGGDIGVFRTSDGGAHWANATAPLGLPNTVVRDLRVSGDGNTLFAATFGRGIWRMEINPPTDHFGVRGIVTRNGAAVAGTSVLVSGVGRIKKYLNNLGTIGLNVTSAPIAVTESAIISEAHANLSVFSASSASLLTPGGATVPMTRIAVIGSLSEFTLDTNSANTLVSRVTAGPWHFSIQGSSTLIAPSIRSASVDFQFASGVSDITGADGEFTLEYLARGQHTVSVPGLNCLSSNGGIECQEVIDVQANVLGLDFRESSQPVLAIDQLGSNVVLAWRTNFNRYMLESKATLDPLIAWGTVAGTPSIVSNLFVVTNKATGNHFYRLRSP